MIQPTDSVHANGAAALARSRHLTRLRLLDLGGHHIGDAGLKDLAESPIARPLEHLDVSYNEIGSIGESGITAVVESPYFDRLRVLNLARNAISPLAADALAHWPQLEQMEVIDLTACDISDAAKVLLQGSPFADRFLLDEPTLIA
jgi:hypothetical protein